MTTFLKPYRSSFKATSFDKTKNESLMMDESRVVYNFDTITEELSQKYRNGENLSSADALAISGDYILLIEFKNQKLSRLNGSRLRKKAIDSALIFYTLKDKFNWENRSVKYIVVYEEDDIPSFTRFKTRLYSYSGVVFSSPLYFGLEKYSYFYESVHTLTVSAFFSSTLYKNISCR